MMHLRAGRSPAALTAATIRSLQPPNLEDLTWALGEQGRSVTGSEYLLAVSVLQFIARQIARFFVNYDVWITPTLAEPPLPLGSFNPQPGDPLYGLERDNAFVSFTPLSNVVRQSGM